MTMPDNRITGSGGLPDPFRPLPDIRHGTRAGFRTEQRRGMTPCSECSAAIREYNRNRPVPQNPVVEHGTYGGYHGHIRRRETPCSGCRDANNAYHRERRRKRTG